MKNMRFRCFYFETALLFIAFIIFSLTGCSSQKQISDALIQLPFENSLENMGTVDAHGEVYSGTIEYEEGQNGVALYTQGDGSWVAFHPKSKIEVGDLVEISFSFKRENWENPYIAGSGSQTIATISGKSEKRMDHLSFGFVSKSSLSFYVYFKDAEGQSHRISTQRDSIAFDWHHVRVLVDFQEGATSLYFDDNPVSRESAVPVALSKGIDRIKFGTWHKKNQAYCGLIDDFMILDIRHSHPNAT
jgi:hypothetical protein